MILLAALLALFAGQAQEERLSKLASALGSSDAAIRERAARELVELGRPALQTLKKIQGSATDPEIRLRAGAAVREIQSDLRLSALKLEVRTDKSTYAPGDVVTATLRLKNVEDFPVTVFLGDPILSNPAQADVFSGAKPVPLVVETYQVAISGPIEADETRFKTIPPGESIPIQTLSFRERWDLQGKDAELKSSYQDAARLPLEAGTYRVRASFGWGFKSKKEKEEARAKAKEDAQKGEHERVTGVYKFTPKAETLLSESWEGALEGSVEFKVAKD